MEHACSRHALDYDMLENQVFFVFRSHDEIMEEVMDSRFASARTKSGYGSTEDFSALKGVYIRGLVPCYERNTNMVSMVDSTCSCHAGGEGFSMGASGWVLPHPVSMPTEQIVIITLHEHLSEICDVVLRLLAASIVHQ
jgi:hypothetical protein